MSNQEELIKKIEDFAPEELTERLISASEKLDLEKQNLKVVRALVYIEEKNKEGKPTEGMVNAQIDTNKKVQEQTAKVIEAEGEYLSAKLNRDDYMEKHQSFKKLADLQKVGF